MSSQILTCRPQIDAYGILDILIIVILGGTLVGGVKTDILGVFIMWLLLEVLTDIAKLEDFASGVELALKKEAMKIIVSA